MRRVTGLAAVGLLLCAPPTALALDVLPAESRLGDRDALLVLRSDGALTVRSDPPILAGAGADELAPTPRTMEPRGTWRGMENVLEVRLQRSDASQTVQVYLEDDGQAGAWVEWPGASVAVAGARRESPGPGTVVLVGLAVAAATSSLRRARA